MRCLDTLRQICRKTHTCKVAYRILNACLKHERVSMDASKAESVMSSHYPDKGRSCAMDNVICSKPKFDVQIIVPVYNDYAYIEDCLVSLLTQKTQYSYHVIVIDDGSDKETRDILRRFAGENRLTIIEQEHQGVSAARNRGLRHVDARYVMFVDADDVLSRYAVESLLDKAYECNSDIIEGSVKSQAGKAVVTHSDMDSGARLSGYPWAKLIKAPMFSHIGFPEGYRYEDTIMSMILYHQAHKMSTIGDTVYYYRQHDGNFTSKEMHNYATLDAYWVVRRLLSDMQAMGIQLDDNVYDSFLTTMKLSGPRISSLDKPTALAYFSAMCAIAKTLFPDDKATRQLRVFDNAVRNNDYTQYLLASYFI